MAESEDAPNNAGSAGATSGAPASVDTQASTATSPQESSTAPEPASAEPPRGRPRRSAARKKLKASGPTRLDEKQLRQRLALHSNGLVGEIHSIAVRQNQLEEAREARLDAKAGGLLGTAGLSLTVAFTFGGLILQHPEYLKPLGPCPARVVLAAYVLALLLGLAAVVWAVRALFVSDDYEALSDEIVFKEDELRSIDETYTASKAAGGDSASDESTRLYQRYITVPLWQIYGAHYAIHQRKANRIRCGQRLFLGFLFVLIVIGAAMTYAAYVQYVKVEAQTSTATE